MGYEVLDPLDYRIDRYRAMGFEHVQAVELANERDPRGGFVYWRDVQAVLERCRSHSMALAVFCGTPTDLAATLGI
jgi:hypothetical protein